MTAKSSGNSGSAYSTNGSNGSQGANGLNVNGVNGSNGANGAHGNGVHAPLSNIPLKPTTFVQEPVAVLSMACRLSDECSNPWAFWKFLEQGKIAINTPPGTLLPQHAL